VNPLRNPNHQHQKGQSGIVMNALSQARVVIVTGGAGGLGSAYVHAFADAGVRVVVNDVSLDRAQALVDEVVARGGDAVASDDDVADWDAAGRMVDAALERWGRLDTVVNNAGVTADRVLVNLEPDQWDIVQAVHLRGTYCLTRRAAAHWRAEHKAGRPVAGRVVNTTSGAGLFGNIGQTNYASAKAGVASFTLVAAAELARYGVTVNAISPAARTPMSDGLLPERGDGAFDPFDPENVAPVVVWLGSERSAEVSGQILYVGGGKVTVMEGWSFGPSRDVGRRWSIDELDDVVPLIVAERRPAEPVIGTSGAQVGQSIR
jgi:NAD(P)-dependent dehydrogenase (short-subunit alcohol dehydrogenase family)